MKASSVGLTVFMVCTPGIQTHGSTAYPDLSFSGQPAQETIYEVQTDLLEATELATQNSAKDTRSTWPFPQEDTDLLRKHLEK